MKNTKRFTEKRTYLAALSFAAAFSMLTGCGKLELNSDEVTVELGSQLSEDPRTYVTLENEEQYNNVAIDCANVNTGMVGNYVAVVSYKDTSYEVKVNVIDTTAPEFEAVDFFEVQAGTELHAEDILTNVSDLSEVSCMITGVTKLGELSEYNDELAASPINMDDTELSEVSGSFPEEGLYEVTAYAVDASGNRSGANAIVVADATAPELTVNGTELEVDATEFSTETTDINEVLNELHTLPWNIGAEAQDNYKLSEDGVSYVITSSEADVTGTNLVERATLTYTLCDAVGNTAEQEVELLVTYAGLDAQTIGKQTGLIEEKVVQQKEQAAPVKSTSTASENAGNTSNASAQNNADAANTEPVAGQTETWMMYDENGNATPVEIVFGGYVEYTAGYQESDAQELFGLINQARADVGLSQLTWSDSLGSLANDRAMEISTDFSHTRPDGTRVSQTYLCAENIAMGLPDASSAHQGFMNSDGHRNIILTERYTQCAVGVYQDSDGNKYFVELFDD